MTMLEIKDLNIFYGNIHAIKGISLNVNEGEIVCLIGANGAGKTSTLQSISGLVPIKSGKISSSKAFLGNIDGEIFTAKEIDFKILPSAIKWIYFE